MIQRRIRAAAIGALAMPLLAACAGEGKSTRGPGDGDVPERVAIPASSVTLGVTIGTMRRTQSLPAFQIAKHPVTVAQFRACLAAGACATPQDGACLDRSGESPFNRSTLASDAAALPATCVGVAQARAFCAWAGGKLPTSSQFMLAARGPAVARFAWGDAAPTCAQRPDDARGFSGPDRRPCVPGPPATDAFAVGKHPAGASPFGVEDVLLAPGELVEASSDADPTACVPPFGACIAHGTRPGAIDSFEPVGAVNDAVARHPYGFRCVWD